MKKKLLFLTKYGNLGASSRLRTLQYLPFLSRFDITVSSLISDDMLSYLYKHKKHNKSLLFLAYIKRFFYLWVNRKKFDIIHIEKEIFPWLPYWFEKILLKNIKYSLDYDDAIFHNYDLHTNKKVRKLLGRKLYNLMADSQIVFAGNCYLKEMAKRSGAKNVIYLPTVIDINRYQVRNNESITPKIVWIGSPSTVKYLNIIENVLKELGHSHQFILRVIGATYSSENFEVEVFNWAESTEVQLIKECDIGIMPLEDSLWEKGKCGYKLIQYMACGLPVIASDVGANKDIVNTSKAGFLASSDDDWLTAFKNLLEVRTLRQTLGVNGRKAVEDKFSVQSQVKVISNAFTQI